MVGNVFGSRECIKNTTGLFELGFLKAEHFIFYMKGLLSNRTRILGRFLLSFKGGILILFSLCSLIVFFWVFLEY